MSNKKENTKKVFSPIYGADPLLLRAADATRLVIRRMRILSSAASICSSLVRAPGTPL